MADQKTREPGNERLFAALRSALANEPDVEGRFVVGGVVGWPHTFGKLLVGQFIGRRLLYRGSGE